MQPTRTTARVATAVALSMIAGVALAGLVLPIVGAVGLVGKTTADTFLALPTHLQTPALAQRTRILDKNGAVIATLFSENRVQVSLSDVPLLARQALIAIEDSRFYEHRGIDVKGTLRALLHNSGSGGLQGGSTLTQQYVKNVLIESATTASGQKAAAERSVRRKLQEARYALALEQTLTKDQILEGYLNIAYYGNGVYGIGTAANHYWGIPVSKLTLAQGALLAGMVQNPRGYDPQAHPKAAVARRNEVLARMKDQGYITSEQEGAALGAPLALHVTTVKSGCEAPGVTAPFFCDYVRRYLEDGPAGAALGPTLQDRQEALFAGGLTIRTTLDPKVQLASQTAVDQQVPRLDPSGAAAVADVVEPGTGAVRAMAVDRGFGTGKGETKVNLAMGGIDGFFAGSTFKIFTLTRALQMGISPGLTLNAPAVYRPTAFTYVTADGCNCVHNAGDSEAGRFSMVQATWESVNTYFMQLAERTGLDAPAELADAMGVRRLDGTFEGGQLSHQPSFVIGGHDGVSPLAMAGAYATFAARGVFCPPSPITSITNGTGAPIALPPAACTQVLDPTLADRVTSILRGVIDGPDPRRTGLGATIGRPAAGKTGTTDKSKAAWFIGYTPQLAAAVWIGKTTPTPMVNITINGRFYPQLYGGSLAAPLWSQLMRGALAGVTPVDFVAPPPLTKASLVAVPEVRGFPTAAAEQQLTAAGFAVTVGPAVNAGPMAAGLIAATDPAPGTQLPVGSTVTIYPSNGLAPSPTPSATGGPGPSPGGSPTPVPSPTPAPSPSRKHGH